MTCRQPPRSARRAVLAALPWLLAPAAAEAEPVVARYAVHAAGMTVMRVEALFDLDAPGSRYRVATRVRLTGMAGLLGSGDQITTAEGRWQAGQPLPQRYRVEGRWRGGARQVAMDYAPGGMPVLQALVPPNEAGREVVPPELQRGTVDALSALAKLTRTVAETGRCDAEAATFDGRRRADYTVRTAGLDLVAIPGGSVEALRCGFESRLIAGRRADQDPEEARRPQPATAWIGRVGPGAAPLPVRIELPSRWFGTIRVDLVAVEPAPPGSALQELAEQRR